MASSSAVAVAAEPAPLLDLCMVTGADVPGAVPDALPPEIKPGRFVCHHREESGDRLDAEVVLAPDGRFTLTLGLPPEDGNGPAKPETVTGRWHRTATRLSLIDEGHPPAIRVDRAWFDPTVRSRIEVRLPDGRLAKDLNAVDEGSSATLSFEGILVTPKDWGVARTVTRLVPEGDAFGSFVGEFDFGPGKPNAYRVTYFPGVGYARNVALFIADANTLVMQAGLGAILLRRQ